MANQPDERGQGLARGLNRTGVAFLVLGLVAMALPAAMTLAVELLIAVLLLVWGAAGLGVSLMLRPARGWAAMALFFALVLALGTLLAVAPRAGIATLTMVMIAVFVVEGVSSILIGLRMRGRTPGWGWIVFSGAASLVLGGLILAGWPGSAAWVLGLLVGFNFLSTGISLLVVGSLLAAPGRG